MIKDSRYFIVLILLFAFFAQGLFLIQHTSPTVDEVPFHIVNGYVFLVTQDYRMSPANPPLVREWMALPWLLIKPKLDLDKDSWRQADSATFSWDFFYKDNRSIADLLLYSARFMVLLLGVGLGLLIFFWSKKMYGLQGGVVSLAAYTLTPGFIAHSAFGTIDIGATFFFMFAAFSLYRYLDKEKFRDLIVFAAASGLMFAAKTNLLFFGPVFLFIILVLKGLRFFLKSTAIFLFVSFFATWACYFFEFKTLLGGGVPRVEEKLGFISAISHAIAPGSAALESFFKTAALTIPIPMPTYFLGIAGIIRHHAAPFEHYIFGQWTTQQPRYTYFFLFYAKMTIPFLILLGMRAIDLFQDKTRSWREEFVILFPVVSYFFVMCFEKTGNGSRYLFPAIALLCVWIGGAGWRRGVWVLLAINALVLMLTFPNYTSYFNQLVGGSDRGSYYTRDSDVDWGQGLKELGRYAKKQNVSQVTLHYFGSADPAFYGISSRELNPEELKRPKNEFYAISVYMLSHLDWPAQYKPTVVLGGSIHVYDFRGGVK